MSDIAMSALKIREKYHDVPIALKMSRETWRRLVVNVNMRPDVELKRTLYGMPVIFDESVPRGKVTEQFQ